MLAYRRKDNSDLWHWREECPDYPLRNYEELATGAGQALLCPKCLAVEVEPDKAAAWHRRAVALEKRGEYIDAQSAYEDSLLLNSRNWSVWLGKCELLAKMGNSHVAALACEKALALGPKDAFLWYRVAQVYSKSSNRVQTLRCLTEAIVLDANYRKTAKTNLAFLWLLTDKDFTSLLEEGKTGFINRLF